MLIPLAESFKKGDMSVFPIIFGEFKHLMLYYSKKSADEDVFGELSVFLLELLYKIEPESFKKQEGEGFKRYIAAALRNRYIQIMKIKQKLSMESLELEEWDSFTVISYENEGLREALESLELKRRLVTELKYIYGYSEAEIAHRLKITRQAVNKHKNNALRDLKEYLGEI